MIRLIGTACFLILTFYQALKILHSLVRKKHISQQTGLLDLPLLGVPRKDGKKISGTAVVCGGSLAGLLAARILHDHFEHVVIVEPEGWLSTEDAWSDNASQVKNKRSRLMQWDSYQTLQAWSASCLSKLFPNLASECTLSQVSIIPADWKVFLSGFEIQPPFNEYNGNNLPPIICAGRPGFETLLRRMVIGRKDYPGIQQVHGTVVGYEKDPGNPQYISKVQIRHGGDNKVDSIAAALVLDCTGPTSAGVKLLRRLGYGEPTSENAKSLDELTISYDHDFHYSNFEVQLTDGAIQRFPLEAREVGPIRHCLPDWMMDRRMVLTQRIDRNIFQAVAAGWGKVELPTNLDEFETFAKSLKFEEPIPNWFFEVIHIVKEEKDKMATKVARIPRCVYTPFHRAERMPSNFVAVGDSVMFLNPIFAQGISKILLGVASLNTLLHEVRSNRVPQDFSKKFFAMQAQKIEPHWDAAKGIDYNYETTTPVVGEALSDNWFVRSYIRSFMRLATKDRHASSTMWHAMHFLAPQIDYLHPYFVPRVLWEMVKPRGSL